MSTMKVDKTPYYAGDAEIVKVAKVSRKLERQRETLDLQAILDKPGGRKFMWRLLQECGVYRTSFTGNSATFYNEGKRAVGLFVLNEIMEASPEAYLLMQKENRKESE